MKRLMSRAAQVSQGMGDLQEAMMSLATKGSPVGNPDSGKLEDACRENKVLNKYPNPPLRGVVLGYLQGVPPDAHTV